MTAKFDRSTFVADISSKCDDIRLNCLDDGDSADKEFCYVIADLFETLNCEQFVYTDGNSDRGIDFFVHQENVFSIYQCKSYDLSLYPKGKTFDTTPVNELKEAIDFVLGKDKKMSGNEKVRSLRNSFQLDQDEHVLNAVLALEGRLSEQGMQRLDEMRKEYQDQHVSIKLITEKEIYEQWHEDESLDPSDIVVKLLISDAVDNQRSIFKGHGWFCAALEIKPLLDAINKYQNALFDLNVRASLQKSKINGEIRKTIASSKGQKRFFHLNNGLVIVCNTISYQSDGKAVSLRGAQVINGCQTLSTIWEYYINASDEEQRSLVNNLMIFAKVIDRSTAEKDGLLEDIIIASNNQNPMNERNLKSNTAEQTRIQKSFYNDPLRQTLRYFYIRKDGEFEAFIKNPGRTPKRQWFQIAGTGKKGINRYRHIENEQLAKIWWAWVGYGSRVNSGGIKFFSDMTYSNIFEKHPSAEFWGAYTSEDYRSDIIDAPIFIEGSPSQYQYLLAMAVSAYIEAKAKPAGGITNYRKERIAILKDKKLIKEDSSKEDIAVALREDPDYLTASWLGQMTYSLTEVASFVLCRKYGALESNICKSLIDLPDVSYWLECGLDVKRVDDSGMNPHDGLLGPLFLFLRKSAEMFFTSNKAAILLDSRPKLYLSREENVAQLKTKCLETDSDWMSYPVKPYKNPNESFFDTLPELVS